VIHINEFGGRSMTGEKMIDLSHWFITKKNTKKEHTKNNKGCVALPFALKTILRPKKEL
jgi:hypothetical protein